MKRLLTGRNRIVLVAAAVVALVAAGGASAYALTHTIMLSPGHCTKVHRQKVCARKVEPKTVTHTRTVSQTVTNTQTQTVTNTVTTTVFPSPVGQMFSGNGDETLNPFTLSAGDDLHWTLTNDTDGCGMFINDNTHSNVIVDSSAGVGSRQTYLDPGSYELSVISCGDWTISF